MTTVRQMQGFFKRRCAFLEEEIATLRQSVATNIAARSAAEETADVAEVRAAAAEKYASAMEARAVAAERKAEIEAHDALQAKGKLVQLESRAAALEAENAFLRNQADRATWQRRVLDRLFGEDTDGLAQAASSAVPTVTTSAAMSREGIPAGTLDGEAPVCSMEPASSSAGSRAGQVTDPTIPSDLLAPRSSAETAKERTQQMQATTATTMGADHAAKAEHELLVARVREVSAGLDALKAERSRAFRQRQDALQAAGQRQRESGGGGDRTGVVQKKAATRMANKPSSINVSSPRERRVGFL